MRFEIRVLLGIFTGYCAYVPLIALIDALGYISRASYSWSTHMLIFWFGVPLSTIAFVVQGQWMEIFWAGYFFLVLSFLGAVMGAFWPGASKNELPASGTARKFMLSLRILWVTFMIAISAHSALSYVELRELNASLGTSPSDDPIFFMDLNLKSGMSRADAEAFVRGYAWAEHHVVGGLRESIYHFRFGLFRWVRAWPEHGRLRISYDEQDRLEWAFQE